MVVAVGVWQLALPGSDDSVEARYLGVTGELSNPPDAITYRGDSESLVVDWDASESGGQGWLETYLDGVGLPVSATMARITGTRALDGTQTASSDDVDATWTFHPDDGLRIVFSAS